MPVEWVRKLEKAPDSPGAFSRARGDPPAFEVHLWPHRSLPNRGFVLFIGLTAGLLAIPLLALLGSPVLWGLLPFFLIALAGVWYALRRSHRDGEILEELVAWSDEMHLTRQEARAPMLTWEANPYWVRATLHDDSAPVEKYLTLLGGEREVELGRFLTPDERATLHADLERALSRLR